MYIYVYVFVLSVRFIEHALPDLIAAVIDLLFKIAGKLCVCALTVTGCYIWGVCLCCFSHLAVVPKKKNQ